MKRLDLAINDKTGILNIPHLTEKCRNARKCIIGLSSAFKMLPSSANWYGVRKRMYGEHPV